MRAPRFSNLNELRDEQLPLYLSPVLPRSVFLSSSFACTRVASSRAYLHLPPVNAGKGIFLMDYNRSLVIRGEDSGFCSDMRRIFLSQIALITLWSNQVC